MNKLRLHFMIIVLCFSSFLFLAGTFTFRQLKVDFDARKKQNTEMKDHRSGRLVNVEEYEKMSNRKSEDPTGRNETIK